MAAGWMERMASTSLRGMVSSGRGEAEAGRDGGAREDGEAVAEELEALEGVLVDGGGDNLAQVVGLDEREDVGAVDEALVHHVGGGDEGGAAGHLAGVELEDGEE